MGYLYGFNGQEKDDEVYGEGNAYDFGARIYDPRIGRWLARDPQYSKYPYLGPYVAFGNNPMYFIDPGGETLHVAGNVAQAEVDMKDMVPTEYQSMVSIVDNKVVFNITYDQVNKANDPGITAMYEMVNSDKNMLWNVTNTVVEKEIVNSKVDEHGTYNVVGVDNVSTASPQYSYKFQYKEKRYINRNGKEVCRGVWVEGERAKYIGWPKTGMDGEVRINDGDWEDVGINNNIENRSVKGFHEFMEMYYRTEKAIPYDDQKNSGAHQRAINDSNSLTDGDKRKSPGTSGEINGVRKK